MSFTKMHSFVLHHLIFLAFCALSNSLRCKEKSSKMTALIDDVWSEHIFSFLHPHQYLSILLTNKHFHSNLQLNNSFRLKRLFLFQDTETNNRFEYPLPYYKFFRTNIAKDIISKYSIVPEDIELKYIEQTMDEALAIEVIKLFRYEVKVLLNVLECSSREWNKLKCILREVCQIFESVTAGTIDDNIHNLIDNNHEHLLQSRMNYQSISRVFYDLPRDKQKLFLLNRNFFLVYIKFNPRVVFTEELGSLYNNDKDIMLELCKVDPRLINAVSADLKVDIEFLRDALKVNSNTYTFIRSFPAVFSDRDIVLISIANGVSLKDFPTYNNDKNCVIKAIEKNPYQIRLASDMMRDDYDVAVSAVSRLGDTIQYLSDRLKNDPDIVLRAVTKNSYALQFVSDKVPNYREIVILAVMKHGDSLKFASEQLKSDKTVVRYAILQDKDAIVYAANDLQNDRDLLDIVNVY
jgi:hypothetical protein